MVILILIGAVWAVIGVLELMATLVMGCAVVTTFFCIIFIGLRFGCVIAMLWGLYYILDELQRHRSRAPMLGGTSLLPMSEDAHPRSQPQGHQQQYGQQVYYQNQGQPGYYQQGSQHGVYQQNLYANQPQSQANYQYTNLA